MQIKRVSPVELPVNAIIRLKHVYHVKLEEFVAISASKEGILFVNHNVPEKDIADFLEVIEYPHDDVADSRLKTGAFLDYVYKEYGFATYQVLLDSHTWHQMQEEQRKAKEVAKVILPLIEKEVNSEHPIVEYNEFLVFEIWKHGFALDKHTPKHMSNYGNVYEFYFGYLMGAGMLKGGVR